ncbi:MAG TPA: hypothetical protein VNF99_02410 [Stellaceae bacterium]|nr:hypothetical protein [Stellaceae bacterium]
MVRSVLVLLVSIAVSGCTGTIMLTPLDPATLGNPGAIADLHSSDAGRAGYDGLLVYLPKQVLEIDRFTQVQTLARDNKTLILSGDCDSAKAYVQKVVTIVDRNKPYLLHYEHGLLETFTFSATLTSDGALASVNTSSTPDQGKTLANLASAAVSASGIAKAATINSSPATCTQTPTFVRYAPLPAIPTQ